MQQLKLTFGVIATYHCVKKDISFLMGLPCKILTRAIFWHVQFIINRLQCIEGLNNYPTSSNEFLLQTNKDLWVHERWTWKPNKSNQDNLDIMVDVSCLTLPASWTDIGLQNAFSLTCGLTFEVEFVGRIKYSSDKSAAVVYVVIYVILQLTAYKVFQIKNKILYHQL